MSKKKLNNEEEEIRRIAQDSAYLTDMAWSDLADGMMLLESLAARIQRVHDLAPVHDHADCMALGEMHHIVSEARIAFAQLAPSGPIGKLGARLAVMNTNLRESLLDVTPTPDLDDDESAEKEPVN